jgi:glycerol kinase
MAGIALGFYTPAILGEVTRTRFEPSMSDHERKKRLEGWKEVVRLAIGVNSKTDIL